MKELVILGLYSSDAVKDALRVQLTQDNDIWTLNDWFTFYPELKHPEKVFDIHLHPTPETSKRYRNYIEKYNASNAEIITCSDYKNFFPKSIKYDFALLEKYGAELYTSSGAYMMAMACKSEYEKINILGFICGAHDEYKWQLPAFLKFIEIARSKGKQVYNIYESAMKSAYKKISEQMPKKEYYVYGEIREECIKKGLING